MRATLKFLKLKILNDIMPENELHKFHRRRMRKRFVSYGSDVFDTHQLMDMLLFHSIRRGDTNGLAHVILNSVPDGGLKAAGARELLTVDGVGENTANLLTVSSAMTVRLLQEKLCAGPLDSEFSAMLYIWLCFADKSEKSVVALLLDEKKRLLEKVWLSRGLSNRPETYTDMLLQAIKAALLHEAPVKNVIIAHNHPDNSKGSSVEDVYLTMLLSKKLSEAGVRLMASYIVTDTDCVKCVGLT